MNRLPVRHFHGLVLAVLAIAALHAQSGGRPELQAVELHPAKELPPHVKMQLTTNTLGQLVMIRSEGVTQHGTLVFGHDGKLTLLQATMRDLITAAFPQILDDDFLSGGPKWLATDRFDLTAVMPADTPVETARHMLQELLKHRFHLQAHLADRPVQVYAMTVSKSGARLRDAKLLEGPAGCRAEPGWHGSGIHRLCHNVTMAVLAQQLPHMAAAYIDRPVIDLTGLTGSYDFAFTWSPMLRKPEPPTTPETAEPSDEVDIFVALEKEVGLKLEARKMNLPAVVIDSVDRTPGMN